MRTVVEELFAVDPTLERHGALAECLERIDAAAADNLAKN
jgi:hypothetical protein